MGRDFPEDFLWGSGTSGYVVEGGNDNADWHAWERKPGTTAAEVCGIAIDHYRRFDEDFALLGSLGQSAHRFSVEWSRIEPSPGEFDEAELAHYEEVLHSLHRHGLTPVMTLYHFVVPQWFADRGGWLAPDALDLFSRYTQVVGCRLGHLAPYVCTVNEPQVLSWVAHAIGHFPPGRQDLYEAARVNAILAAAHRRAVAVLRTTTPEAKVGTCLAIPAIEPLCADTPGDVTAARYLDDFFATTHLDDLSRGGDVGDWVGLQYYTRLRMSERTWPRAAPVPEGVPTTQMGWDIHPEGFGRTIRRVAAATGLPVIVTENGIATDDDAERLHYLREHLEQVRDALADGVDVRGYLHFSSFDAFEWAHGFGPRFGLVGIDRDDDLRRVVRPSAEAYARLIRTGRLDALTLPDPSLA